MHPAPESAPIRAVAWQAYAILAVIALLATLLPSGDPGGDSALPVRLAGTLALLVVAAIFVTTFIELVRRWWWDNAVPAWISYAFAVIGSALGDRADALIRWWLDGSSPTLDWADAIGILIVGPAWILLIGFAVISRARYLARRAELIDEQTMRTQVGTHLNGVRSMLAERIDLIRDAPAGSLTSTQASTIAGDLRTAASDTIRPLSHAVWGDSESAPSPAARNPLRFIARVVATQPFRPLLIWLLYITGALAPTLDELGTGPGLVTLLIDSAYVIVVLGLANLVLRTRPAWRAVVYPLTLVVFLGVPLILGPVAGAEQAAPFSARIVEAVITLILILATSSLGLLGPARQRRLDLLARRGEATQQTLAAESTDLVFAARAMAGHLHSSVQSSLIAAAATVERSIDSGDYTSAEEALLRVETALTDALSGDEALPPLGERLAFLATDWDELCRVEIHVDPDLADRDDDLSATIARIVREAVTNAFRHGGATHVDIAITTIDPAGVEVCAVDDGSGPGHKSWGLGLTLVDEATGGHWTLTRDDDVTVLRARLVPGQGTAPRSEEDRGAAPPLPLRHQ